MNTVTAHRGTATLAAKDVRRLMRANKKTIQGIARCWNLTQVRVRHVRSHGVSGAAFVQDCLEILS